MSSAIDITNRRLPDHLTTWLGRWPTSNDGLDVAASGRRERPGWDGAVHPAIGVSSPDGGVLSVAPRHLDDARALVARPDHQLLSELPAAVDRPQWHAYRAVFRFGLTPAALPEAGIWIPADHPTVPDWLRIFGGEVLVALDPDTGAYLAGVGIKRHDRYGHELAVGTEAAARGRGLARRLVAQAARRVLDDGAIPTYLHAPSNIASARAAEAAGFADRGWTAIGIADQR